LFDAVSVRVHLNKDNKVAYIALPQWDPLQLLDRHKNIGIASIDGYNEDKATVNLKTSTDANKFPGVTRITGTAADRMLFLGCLEAHCQAECGKDGVCDKEGKCSKCGAEWIPSGLGGNQLLKFLVDHLDRNTTKFSDDRLEKIAADTKADWETVEYSRRRRLVEVAYYSFIGFNMLLMCCLLVGISFAYHVGTHEVNHEPIRW